MNNKSLVILAIIALTTLTACGPRDYDGCILEAMKGVNNDTAAKAIVRSCRDKFPVRRPQDSALPKEALRQLNGHGGMDYGSFSGKIYNGNQDWTVTQVTIRLVPKGKEKVADAIRKAKKYNDDVTIAPLTSMDFSFLVEVPEPEYHWNIVRARGYRSR